MGRLESKGCPAVDTNIALGSDATACAPQGYKPFKLNGETEF
jgi:hypothetical protein